MANVMKYISGSDQNTEIEKSVFFLVMMLVMALVLMKNYFPCTSLCSSKSWGETVHIKALFHGGNA